MALLRFRRAAFPNFAGAGALEARVMTDGKDRGGAAVMHARRHELI
jgi:hypothetical protein